MNDSTPSMQPPVEPAVHRLVYDGRLGRLFSITLINLTLTILTFGVYRFWGIARLRAYVWSRLSVLGRRFEYTGTGGELFVGFLKGLAIFAPMVLGLFAIQIAGEMIDPTLADFAFYAIYTLFMYIVCVAVYGASRYRMSRTRWSAIRLRLAGSAWRFGLMLMGAYTVAGLTLGLAWPFLRMWLNRYYMENLSCGTAPFRFDGHGRDLFKAFLLPWILSLPLVAGFAWTWWFMFIAYFMEDWGRLALNALGVLGSAIALIVVWCGYVARRMAYDAERTSLLDLRFAMPVGGVALARLLLVNYGLLIVSFGLLLPLTIHRTLSFWAHHLTILGTLDERAIAQAAQGEVGAEGMASVLGLDTITP